MIVGNCAGNLPKVITGKNYATAENRFTSDEHDYIIERCIELYVLIVNDLSTD